LEIFLNPNTAYLLLVVGFLLGILAVLTPGTTVLELTAVFVLILGGWSVYQLDIPLNLWALVVLLVGVFPFMLALRKSGRIYYLAFAILALMVGSAYLFRRPVWWQPGVSPLLALVVSLFTGSVLWFIASKVLEAERAHPAHDLRTLIGETGTAKTDISQEGSVQVSGELWSARSNKPIPQGSLVRVVGREGFILEVEPVEASEAR